jgi:hypothetical protein
MGLTPLLLLTACGSGAEFVPHSPSGSSVSSSSANSSGSSSSSSSSGGSTSSSSSSSGGAASLQLYEFATTGLASGQSFSWDLSYAGAVVGSGTVASNGTSAVLEPDLPSSETYAFTIVQQPTGQTCSLANSTGTIASAPPPTVVFTCVDSANSPAAIEHALTTPGPRSGASTWALSRGSFVLFGGESQDAGGVAENDLWRYAASGQVWTRIEAATTPPAARSFAASWLDARGDLWIFGGRDNTRPEQLDDDLWEFTPATRAWTCQSGCAGDDGITGDPRPAARMGATTWVDADGDLWLDGGTGATGAPIPDVWRFTPATRAWTPVRGP